ncbi:MAG: hypothetical protein PHY09_10460 [Desulfuromonadaceae bacterium]|nr:hypothetical protein [Desulfuromonadaceae bacterium]MDD5107612.1 hypothetical protein [Desulfuromonadaceae bacterium]
MSIAQISPFTVLGNSSQTTSLVEAYKSSPPVHTGDNIRKAVLANSTDTVTISRQALQMAGRSAAVENESTNNVSNSMINISNVIAGASRGTRESAAATEELSENAKELQRQV